ncbi:tail spike protein [Vibrio phage vB_VspP_pVa5]|uniref:Pectate lyase superfamily protein domain-containing protein n=1 Tax=Vibrio phage vB_VspP_pVa5 TaxID=1913109 RepID=A0A1J0GV21_9CAUD|nr:tail spike protein [Vibrio phage vB_VspP_pVa5]APC46030.1 hypothetical protein vBVspPpVa5_0007 [Vibrio phage vB_VspP_pVa5]
MTTKVNNRMIEGSTINVLDFGAVGDGLTDDYDALVNAFAEFSATGGILSFEEGKTYYIDRYRDTGNTNRNLALTGVTGTTILGNGATIKFRGDFHRSGPDQRGLGLSMIDLNDVQVYNLNLEGGVQTTTRDPGVTEAGGSGFFIQGCKNMSMFECSATDFWTDGFQVTSSGTAPSLTASQGVTLHNCEAHRCARNNISLIQIRGFTANYFRASDAGRTGTYDYHLPASNTWIEPNYRPDTLPTFVDELTGEITFNQLQTDNAIGSEYGASGSLEIGRVVFEGGNLAAADDAVGGTGNPEWAVLVVGADTTFRNMTFKLDTPNAPHIHYLHNDNNGSFIIKDSVIRTNGRGIYRPSSSSSRKFIVMGCLFDCRHTTQGGSVAAPSETDMLTPSLWNMDRHCYFVNNEIRYAAAMYGNRTGRIYGGNVSALFCKENNWWSPDWNTGLTVNDYLAPVLQTRKTRDEYFRNWSSTGVRPTATSNMTSAFYESPLSADYVAT